MTIPVKPPAPQPNRPPTGETQPRPLSPPPPAPPNSPPPPHVETFTHTPLMAPPRWHRFVFPTLVLVIMLSGLGISVAIVSNRQNSQEIRTPAEVSPPTTRCSLELNTSETVASGKYTLNVAVTYTGSQESVDLTYYWARCRCQEGGGNQTQRGKPICKSYWPDDPGECSIGSQQTVSLRAGSPRSFSQTVSQYNNLDCGAYQIDFVVVDVSGEVCNISVPASGFYPTGENCQLPTPTPSPAPKKICQQSCGGDNDCEGNLVCDNGKCVNSECRGELDCVCPGRTPSPSPTPAPPKVEKPTKLPPASGGYGILHAFISFLKSLTPLP